MSDTPETDAFIGEGNDGSFMTEGEIAMCEFRIYIDTLTISALG